MYNGILFGNKIADIVFVALFSAQALKVIISLFTEKKVNFRRFLDTGSMPSSHTSSVVSLTTAIAIKEGLDSTLFILSLVFAVVVMYDATGVRRAAGKQAAVLNKIVENVRKKEGHSIIEENLKELLGHTPIEVFGGAILGVVVAFLMS
ncbi:MAG: divergent PAP2 family protein [Candidatus Cloacimonetes bacterium]|nr:divergent PAP2 family protein [Candidatus Cloacimonadota bacterium]MCF7815191.1 divergent PAP2 family protein [Candidatus Cloacimonadota bacterium]MCF7867855.1 divergent PAP2 family protein [Candidatus Cloacimonadota bacterium]MCF7884291.1 divergent PAP2 family protein [Candidatus Cloacimonadota bacterium]